MFGLLLSANPLLTGEPVGGLFFNLILLGYGIPAVLAAALGADHAATRPHGLSHRSRRSPRSCSCWSISRSRCARSIHGPVLTAAPISDAEQYTYSAVWLAFGVVLLLVGICAALAAGAARLGGGRAR